MAFPSGSKWLKQNNKHFFLLQTGTGAATELFSTGRHLEPTIASLPSGELILCRDDISIITDSDGKKTQKQTLTWSDTPTELGEISTLFHKSIQNFFYMYMILKQTLKLS